MLVVVDVCHSLFQAVCKQPCLRVICATGAGVSSVPFEHRITPFELFSQFHLKMIIYQQQKF